MGRNYKSMDAGVQGGLIGIGFMVFIVIVCTIRERCQKTSPTDQKVLVKEEEPISIQTLITKKQSSMRDLFKENTSGSQLKVIRIS